MNIEGLYLKADAILRVASATLLFNRKQTETPKITLRIYR